MVRGVRPSSPALRSASYAQVNEGLEAEPRHQQPDLARLAERGQVAHRGPELVRLDVEVLDGAEQVGDDAVHDALHARVALVGVEAGGHGQQGLHLGCAQWFIR